MRAFSQAKLSIICSLSLSQSERERGESEKKNSFVLYKEKLDQVAVALLSLSPHQTKDCEIKNVRVLIYHLIRIKRYRCRYLHTGRYFNIIKMVSSASSRPSIYVYVFSCFSSEIALSEIVFSSRKRWSRL